MSSWCVLVAASVSSVIQRRTVVRTAMVARTAMVVRTANQRATIRAAVKRGDVRPVEKLLYASTRGVWCEPSARTAIVLACMCKPSAGGRATAVAKHSRAKKWHCLFPAWSY
jgi:hypothetical protein